MRSLMDRQIKYLRGSHVFFFYQLDIGRFSNSMTPNKNINMEGVYTGLMENNEGKAHAFSDLFSELKPLWWSCIARVTFEQWGLSINTLRPRQNGHHFPDDNFKCIFLNENVWIWIKISLKFVPKGLINKIPALVQVMAWCRPGAKPLSEPMLISLPTHICVTRPQWVKDCKVELIGVV